jgi:hypothetical protein
MPGGSGFFIVFHHFREISIYGRFFSVETTKYGTRMNIHASGFLWWNGIGRGLLLKRKRAWIVTSRPFDFAWWR